MQAKKHVGCVARTLVDIVNAQSRVALQVAIARERGLGVLAEIRFASKTANWS